MHKLDLDAFRTTLDTGGIISVALIGHGGTFHITAETRGGEAVLTKARSTVVRQFRDVQRATLLLRDLGIREFSVDTKNWRPEQADIGRAKRPDRTKALHEALEAKDLKQTIETAIKQANDPNTAWIDHDELFDKLEARYAV